MSAEEFARGKIRRELAKIRLAQPDAETVRREWRIANAKYVDHVSDGQGDPANGAAILAYYVTRQAYAMYADEIGIELEVE